jgi:hypothetical protein
MVSANNGLLTSTVPTAKASVNALKLGIVIPPLKRVNNDRLIASNALRGDLFQWGGKGKWLLACQVREISQPFWTPPSMTAG